MNQIALPANTTPSTGPSALSTTTLSGGVRVRSAHDCWYPPAVHPTDLLHVDFDVHAVQTAGLYLVEEVSGANVLWRGCRRYRVDPLTKHVELDADGEGSWMAADVPSWRIAGKVLQVYRPTA